MKMNCKTAKQINIVQFLILLGHKPVVRKSNDVWFKSPLRLENTASFKVDEKKNFWYDFGEGIGGTLIDLVLNILNTNNVSEALQFIEKHSSIAVGRKKLFSFTRQNTNGALQSSDRDIEFSILDSPMLKGYLKNRGISNEFSQFVKQGIEKKTGKTYFYLAFKNNKGGYELRNKYYKGCTHPKWLTTIKNNPDYPIFIFEGFFDFLSIWEVARRNHSDEVNFLSQSNFLILNSIALLEEGINVLKPYSDIRLFLDNDPAGIQAAKKVFFSFPKANNFSNRYTGFKDLNEFIINGKTCFKIE